MAMHSPASWPETRQRGVAAEKVLGIVHPAVLVPGDIFQIKGGDVKHFPRALAVARGDEGGVGVYETLLLKEAVDRVGRNRPHPEHRVKGVCPGTQMRDGAQEFEGMALLLQRIIRRGRALDLDGGGVQLTGLLGLGGEDQTAFHAQGGHRRSGGRSLRNSRERSARRLSESCAGNCRR